MPWSLQTYNKLTHYSGVWLHLVAGTWKHPQKIVPMNIGHLNDYDAQKLIEDGVRYVTQHISELELELLTKLEQKKYGNNPPKVKSRA